MVIKYIDQHKNSKSKILGQNVVRKLHFWNWVKYNLKSQISQYQNTIRKLNKLRYKYYNAKAIFAKIIFLIKNDVCLNNYKCFSIGSLIVKKC